MHYTILEEEEYFPKICISILFTLQSSAYLFTAQLTVDYCTVYSLVFGQNKTFDHNPVKKENNSI